MPKHIPTDDSELFQPNARDDKGLLGFLSRAFLPLIEAVGDHQASLVFER